jgi:drug/metabolite transporter (DMT)-like permease
LDASAGITTNGSQPREKYERIQHTVRALRRVIVTGAIEGVLLSMTLTAWLLIANRVPYFDRFALVRNAIAVAVLFLAGLIPVARFRNSPKDVLPAGAIGLGMACLVYWAWTIYFEGLSDRMSAFQIFVMGLVAYTLAAVLLWVGNMIRSARHHHHLAVQHTARKPIH